MEEAMSHCESWQLSPAASQMKTRRKEKSDQACSRTLRRRFHFKERHGETETFSAPRGAPNISAEVCASFSLTIPTSTSDISPATYILQSLAAVA